MIHATTHSAAKAALRQRALPLHRLGSRSFAALLGVELVLLLAVLFWALVTLLPPATPLAAAGETAPIAEAIQARLSGEVNDPLLTVADGQSVRASNLRGFRLDGQTFYYYVEGAKNFDPLSRGAVSPERVETLLRDDSGPTTFVVYRIR